MKVLFAVCLLGLSLTYAKPLDLDLIEKLLDLEAEEELETRDGNHWGKTDHIDAINTETMVEEWKELVRLQDVDSIVTHFADDGVYIRQKCQGNTIGFGKKDAKTMYQSWFDSGVARLEVDIRDEGKLDDGNMYLLERVTAFNNSDDLVETSTILLIFRKLKDGFETLRKTQIVDYLDGC